MSDELKTAFTTGLNTIKTDTLAMVGIALPIGLGIYGLFLSIRLGMKFFRSVAK